MKKYLFVIAIIALGANLIWQSVATPLAQAATSGTRVVYGFDREYPPFSYEDPGGKAVGFDIDIMQAIFKNKASLYMRPLNWSAIQVELAQGTINVASSVVRTPARARNFSFSDSSTFDLKMRFFTKIHKRVPNASFLKGQAVAVEDGSTQKALLEKFGGINIKPFRSRALALRALYNEEVDAYCGADEPSYYIIRKLNYGAITTLGAPLGSVEMRIAVNRERGDILRMVNDGLKELYTSGEYNRIYRRWFITELDATEQAAMLKACQKALISSYAPYGKKSTAAAVITATGKVYAGANIENADPSRNISPLSNALSHCMMANEQEIRAAMIIDQSGKVQMPTQADCQLMYEYGRGVLMVIPYEGKTTTPMVVEVLKKPVNKKIFNLD